MLQCYEKNPMATIKSNPIIGTMASESKLRLQSWILNGCNSFDTKKPKSQPLSFWTEKDIWDYIKTRGLNYSKIYDMGYERTGCVFCMFGLWSEPKYNNRFIRLKKTHPKLYKYCMENLGLKEIINWVDLQLDKGQPDLFEENNKRL